MPWIDDQRALMMALNGAEIVSATAVEMALVDAGANGLPVFRHQSLPFIQCHYVELKLADGRFALFHNYQNDDVFGVMLEMRDATSVEAHWSDSHRNGEASIYRLAPDLEGVIGCIANVSVTLDAGDISNIELTLPGTSIALKAGEVCEDLTVTDMDESILLFVDAKKLASVTFNSRGEWIPVFPLHPKTT